MKYLIIGILLFFSASHAFADEEKSSGRIQSEHTEHPPHDHQEHDHLKVLKDMDKRRKRKSHD